MTLLQILLASAIRIGIWHFLTMSRNVGQFTFPTVCVRLRQAESADVRNLGRDDPGLIHLVLSAFHNGKILEYVLLAYVLLV